VQEGNQHDLVHYLNWDIRNFYDVLPNITKPMLVSVRSHRYDPIILDVQKMPNKYIHVINKYLVSDFENATYIPNGIFDRFKPDHEFTVGFAGRPEYHAKQYKGVELIERACEELGVKFKPAFGEIKPEDMMEYYKSIDVYVCASENEGFSTPVMECMAINKPVITVDVGTPREFNVIKVHRTVEGIKDGIQKLFTQNQVKDFTWESVNKQYYKLYQKICSIS
jgi:glycosyltransferase involved in cell wall biosynthesis